MQCSKNHAVQQYIYYQTQRGGCGRTDVIRNQCRVNTINLMKLKLLSARADSTESIQYLWDRLYTKYTKLRTDIISANETLDKIMAVPSCHGGWPLEPPCLPPLFLLRPSIYTETRQFLEFRDGIIDNLWAFSLYFVVHRLQPYTAQE